LKVCAVGIAMLSNSTVIDLSLKYPDINPSCCCDS
jgi:hypothetical protein